MLKNSKGENLYIFTCVSTNDLDVYVKIDTWENCMSEFEFRTQQKDDGRMFVQLIHREIRKDFGRAEASTRCNRIGWGSDFFRYIRIVPAAEPA